MNKKGLIGLLVIILILVLIGCIMYLLQVGYFTPANTACEELGYTHGIFNGDGANIDCYTIPYEIECKLNFKKGLVCER